MRYGVHVSTHSRPKAAGQSSNSTPTAAASFNTQPPEGGWEYMQATFDRAVEVSTHSRPKAAGTGVLYKHRIIFVSTHSRPKAAGSYKRALIM